MQGFEASVKCEGAKVAQNAIFEGFCLGCRSKKRFKMQGFSVFGSGEGAKVAQNAGFWGLCLGRRCKSGSKCRVLGLVLRARVGACKNPTP